MYYFDIILLSDVIWAFGPKVTLRDTYVWALYFFLISSAYVWSFKKLLYLNESEFNVNIQITLLLQFCMGLKVILCFSRTPTLGQRLEMDSVIQCYVMKTQIQIKLTLEFFACCVGFFLDHNRPSSWYKSPAIKTKYNVSMLIRRFVSLRVACVKSYWSSVMRLSTGNEKWYIPMDQYANVYSFYYIIIIISFSITF